MADGAKAPKKYNVGRLPACAHVKPVNSQNVDLALCEYTFKAASDQVLDGESLRFVDCQGRLTGSN